MATVAEPRLSQVLGLVRLVLVRAVGVSARRVEADTSGMQRRDGLVRLSPSDLSNFLACEHLSALEVLGAPRPSQDVQVELIRRKGKEHERAYLEQLRADGRNVVEIGDGDWEERAAATEQALRDGVDVVYQGGLHARPLAWDRRLRAAVRPLLRSGRHEARPARE